MSFLKKLKDKILLKQKPKDVVMTEITKHNKKILEERYQKALKKSNVSFFKKIKYFLSRNREIDEDFFEKLTEILVSSDVGIEYAIKLVELLKKEVKLKNIKDHNEIFELIVELMHKLYVQKDEDFVNINIDKNHLNTILIIGVNGVGKTTSIGKLAKKLVDDGFSVLIAACDTFRAGAIEQLKIWAERVNVQIVVPDKDGQDPGSVAYKAIKIAKQENVDIVIIDTAGRLQNKKNLLEELNKLKRIVVKETGREISEKLLVLDATIGQNGINQTKIFNELIDLTGIILTKMDSTSKGGTILAIREVFKVPVKFIGYGEGIDDLKLFDIDEYLYSMIERINIEQENDNKINS